MSVFSAPITGAFALVALLALGCDSSQNDSGSSRWCEAGSDTGASSGFSHPLCDHADLREVVWVAWLSGQLAAAAINYITFYNGGSRSCPQVTETSPGEWTVGDVPCTQEGSEARFEGSYTASGVRWKEKGAFIPDSVDVDWTGFSTTVPPGPWGGEMSEVVDGEATFDLLEQSLGGGGFDLTIREEGPGCELVAAGGVSERQWTVSGLERSNLWMDGTDEMSGVVDVAGVGDVSLEGQVGWDRAVCDSEPVDGTLTVTGAREFTLVFDGATACDGTTPYSGDEVGVVAWNLSG